MESATRRRFSAWQRAPWGLIFTWAMLVAVGLIAIARCEELSGDGFRYLIRQIVWCGVAIIAMTVTATVDYRRTGRFSYAIYAIVLLSLIAVFFFRPINGATRWIRFGPISLQPSEFAKVALLVALARYMMFRENYRRLLGMTLPMLMTFVPMLLILREPDLGTSLVLLPVLLTMLLIAGASVKDLARVALLGLLLAPLLWANMSAEQRSRVTSLYHQAEPGQSASDDAYHLRQAKQMIALGDRWGSLIAGPTSDDPGVYHLPEARSDFIFCVIGERLGLPGMATVLVLYGLLLTQIVGIARTTHEPLGRLIATGVAALIGVQVVINTGMNVGLLPITGMSLPMISYGGSGLLANAIGIGLVVSIAIHRPFEVTDEPFRYENR